MFSKNSKIQAKIPKIQPVFAVISAKNQKFKGIYRGVNFWILQKIWGKKSVILGGGQKFKNSAKNSKNSTRYHCYNGKKSKNQPFL